MGYSGVGSVIYSGSMARVVARAMIAIAGIWLLIVVVPGGFLMVIIACGAVVVAIAALMTEVRCPRVIITTRPMSLA